MGHGAPLVPAPIAHAGGHDRQHRSSARLLAFRARLREQLAPAQERELGPGPFLRLRRRLALEDQALRAVAARDEATAALRWREAAAIEDGDPPLEGADGLGGDHTRAGMSFLRAGEPKEAGRELLLAQSRYPGWAPTWTALGQVADKRGDRDGARRAYGRAAEIWAQAEPDFAPAKAVRDWLTAHPAQTR